MILGLRVAATETHAYNRVEVVGVVRQYRYEAQVVEDYIDECRALLKEAVSTPRKRGAPANLASLIKAAEDAEAWQTSMIFGQALPEDRTNQEYVAEISVRRENVRKYVPKFFDAIAAYVRHGSTLRLLNDGSYF